MSEQKGGYFQILAAWVEHVELIAKQDGLAQEAAKFLAECEGPEGFIRCKEIETRGGVAA
jgi:hypothetical protein